MKLPVKHVKRLTHLLRQGMRAEVMHKVKAPLATMLGLLTIVSSLSGCMIVHNAHRALVNSTDWSDTVMVLRNRSMSAKAWHRRKHHFCNEKYIKDFCAGFRTGYEDVANGKDGCTPSFPPKEYWGWEFQSAEGAARTSAWYSGYPQGVRAAEEEGVAHWNQLQMSTGLQAQYQQAGMFQHEGALYPIPSDQGGTVGEPLPVPEGQIIQEEAMDIIQGVPQPIEGATDPLPDLLLDQVQ